MTLAELMNHIAENTDLPVMDGDAAQTLEKARADTHREPVVAEILRTVVEKNDCGEVDCVLERAAVVTPLGPVRLKYMADDAPVEGFRLVENFIRAVDDAYNDEALRQRHGA